MAVKSLKQKFSGVDNCREYLSEYYLGTLFADDAAEKIKELRAGSDLPPFAALNDVLSDLRRRYGRELRDENYRIADQDSGEITAALLNALDYGDPEPELREINSKLSVTIIKEVRNAEGSPLLWIFSGADAVSAGPEAVPGSSAVYDDIADRCFFDPDDPPRFIMLIDVRAITLLDRNSWGEKRFLRFSLPEILPETRETSVAVMYVSLSRRCLVPEEGQSFMDACLDRSVRSASGISQDLKYSLRESIELIGNEVLRSFRERELEEPEADELTLQCLRYMYRVLFLFFIEARPELGYAPIKNPAYMGGYSLEALRDMAEDCRPDRLGESAERTYIHQSLERISELIYEGYPAGEKLMKMLREDRHGNVRPLNDIFIMEPLKAHIFDPERTPLLSWRKGVRLRNSVMLRVIGLMSTTHPQAGSKERPRRISYAELGISQLGSVYEALLSYQGFIAKERLFEVRPQAGGAEKKLSQREMLNTGYFVNEEQLEEYSSKERVYVEEGTQRGMLRSYPKGSFIYRMAGLERKNSASYYTPESLAECLVKYALKELLDKETFKPDDILHLAVLEPAMGSAAFLNEVINQLSIIYLERKQKELDRQIPSEDRLEELQKVKMYLADRCVYGVDLNPVAVELAEVSLLLNCICKGGYVPWFGMQLVCGNSLIGARREFYNAETLQKGRWYEKAPVRVKPGKKRGEGQAYHFLAGDPAMAQYDDKVIKNLVPDQLKKIKAWQKEFCSPYDEGQLRAVLEISGIVDELWKQQASLRRTLDELTADAMGIFGHEDPKQPEFKTGIRGKDRILDLGYYSREVYNAGPYARLKAALDYWCALWFWPIEKADELPSKDEFLYDMQLLLSGSVDQFEGRTGIFKNRGQMKLFESSDEGNALERVLKVQCRGFADLEKFRELRPRLETARLVAEKQHFLHLELEFADRFENKGGFDLVVGNPPWVKLGWNETNVLAECDAKFAVKKLTAKQSADLREEAFRRAGVKDAYLQAYEQVAAQQNFLNAVQNYPLLKGQQTNLFKCFLPQGWNWNSDAGVSAFVHPEGVYDDPNGGELRETLYRKLRFHFQFENECKLFPEVDHHTTFSLNVYGCQLHSKRQEELVSFDSIGNLFDAATVTQCYLPSSAEVPGIKDGNGSWSLKGHPQRVLHITPGELAVFAKVFDNGGQWAQAKLPVLHSESLLRVLKIFSAQKTHLGDLADEIGSARMWDETNAQKDGTILRKVHFPQNAENAVYSGPHIGVANPFFKSSRRICKLNTDYDNIDLTILPEEVLPRLNYVPACSAGEYLRRAPGTPWGSKYHKEYRVIFRRMLNQAGERTLVAALIPPGPAHIHTVFGLALHDLSQLAIVASSFASIPFDFFTKASGKNDIFFDLASKLPLLPDTPVTSAMALRGLLLNCLTRAYAPLWREVWRPEWREDSWSCDDPHLARDTFSRLSGEWNMQTPLRTAFERRRALVEIDVLAAMALGMTLEQLLEVYRIQFPVLRAYESDTWYDADGRIIFTVNRSQTGVGLDRKTWSEVQNLPEGETFTRQVADDTLPGGPVNRDIVYKAPFVRCLREDDYRKAWACFEKRFKKRGRK